MMQAQIRSAATWTRKAALLGTAIAALTATAARAQGQAAKAPPGVVEFAGSLTRSHGNLFDADARSPLDQLNRRLREANDQRQKAPDDAARNEAGTGDRLVSAADSRVWVLVFATNEELIVARRAYSLLAVAR